MQRMHAGQAVLLHGASSCWAAVVMSLLDHLSSCVGLLLAGLSWAAVLERCRRELRCHTRTVQAYRVA